LLLHGGAAAFYKIAQRFYLDSARRHQITHFASFKAKTERKSKEHRQKGELFPSSRAEHRRNGREKALSLFEAFRHRREAEFERAPPVSRSAGRSGTQGALSFGYFTLGEQRKVSIKKNMQNIEPYHHTLKMASPL